MRRSSSPTASGTGWLRYNGDGYGDCVVGAGTSCTIDGAPWTNGGANTGTGHPWPVLGAERAQQYLALGQKSTASGILATINRMNSGPGLVPEQVWDYPNLPRSPYGTDPATRIHRLRERPGGRVGVAAHLGLGLAGAADRRPRSGRSVEQPSQVRDRYVTHTQAEHAADSHLARRRNRGRRDDHRHGHGRAPRSIDSRMSRPTATRRRP